MRSRFMPSRNNVRRKHTDRTEMQRAYRYQMRLLAPVLTGIAFVVIWMVLADQPVAAFAIGLDLVLVALFMSLRANIVAHGQVRRLQCDSRHLEAAQRVAGLGSWEWDLDSGSMTWSDEMCRLCGVEPDECELSFQLLMSKVSGAHRARIAELIGQAVGKGDSYDVDMPVMRGDGATGVLRAQGVVHVAVDVSAGQNPRGRRMVGTLQDVTELRMAEAAKDEFVATASHELRTPTTLITGFAETLHSRWDELDEQCRRECVSQINAGSIRLTRLISDLLHSAQLDTHQARATPIEFSMAELVRETVNDVASDRVQVSIDDGAGELLAFADPSRQRQVLDNLVTNALRYSPPDEPIVIELSLDDATETPMLKTRVVDFGGGVPPSSRERVFERFARLDGSVKAQSPAGTGLGLYISRKLVQMSGGEIYIEDGPTGGAAFVFTTPRARRLVAQRVARPVDLMT